MLRKRIIVLLSGFNSQPPEGGCALSEASDRCEWLFQLTAARRRLPMTLASSASAPAFQLTAARRRLRQHAVNDPNSRYVSTHSRPKAAARKENCASNWYCSFNSQPPEGGCWPAPQDYTSSAKFQLTAARRRLLSLSADLQNRSKFQLTAARRRLQQNTCIRINKFMFQLTAARRRLPNLAVFSYFNSRFQLTAARRRLRPVNF